MLFKVKPTIEKYNMLQDGDNVVLGISGGVDSMALLHILIELQSYYDISLYLAHVNHGVRGEYAKRDQLFVEKVAKDLKLPYYTIDVDMDAYAKKHRITSEEAGRILRYDFFNEIVEELGHGKIAVAHNLNDQAETLIMRFLRGTGIDGLRGIEYTNDNIIRPILGISREELEEYIKKNDIEITEDHTNFQPIYTRNKIRLEIIPYIEKNFNPNIVKTLERTSELAVIDTDFLEKHTNNRYNEVVKKEKETLIILDSKSFNQEHISIKQRMIRLAIESILGSLQGISQSQVNIILELFESKETGKQVNITEGIVARVSYDDLIIEKNKSKEIKQFEYDLINELDIDEIGYEFSFQLFEDTKFHKITRKANARYFDYDKIVGELRIRNRIDGDRFNPFGMKGSKKIKDYFIDEKIPRDKRDKIPLLVDDKNILWVVGYRTSEIYRITDNTKNILEISYKKN